MYLITSTYEARVRKYLRDGIILHHTKITQVTKARVEASFSSALLFFNSTLMDDPFPFQSGRESLARGVLSFSRQWMTFVLERCERGRGIKPRWAAHGIDFLFLASDPRFTRYVTDDEFCAFKDKVDKCYSHVIGEMPSPGSGTPSGAISPDAAARHSRSPLGTALASRSRTNSPRRRPASSTRATEDGVSPKTSLPRLHVRRKIGSGTRV